MSHVNIEQFACPFAVTLTLKQGLDGAGGTAGRFQRIDEYEASKNFRHFMNLLNRQVYGHAAQRHGKRLNVLPVMEQGKDIRLHYHAIIDCPRPQLEREFPAMIRDCWLRTPWGYKEINVQSCYDQGWVSYISKFDSKLAYADAYDWTNCHLD